MAVKVIGIIGSYRKGKTIDSAVSEVLEGAKAGEEIVRQIQANR